MRAALLFAVLVTSLAVSPARADLPTERRVAALRARLDRAPAEPTARVELADLLERSGRHEEALDELDLLDALSPHDPRGAAVRARALIRLDRPDEALDVLDRLVRDTEGSAEAHALRAQTLETLGRLPEALAERETVVALAPGVQSHLDHGRLLERLGRDEDALGVYERSAERTGASPLRDAAIATARRLDRPARALVQVEALLRQARIAPRWRVLRAELLDELGRGAEASEERRRALAEAERMLARRSSPLALMERGRALLALGRRAEARADLAQASRRAPSLAEARALLASAGGAR